MPTPKQRLRYALSGALLDRPPALCLGGSMSAAVREVLDAAGVDFAAVHGDPRHLAAAALAVARATGFENVGLPLCATVEAEALGSVVAPADPDTEPRIARERWRTIEDVESVDIEAALGAGRVPAFLEAVAIASEEAGDLPVIANVLGPVTLAGSLVEPTALLRAMVQAPARVHALLDQLDAFLATLLGRLAVMGADAVAIHEDMGDPRSVGPRAFEAFTVVHLTRLVAALRGPVAPVATPGHEAYCACPACRVGTALDGMRRDVPVIVHCCELSPRAWPLLPAIGASAWSVGHATSVQGLLAAQPDLLVLGNVSTTLLHRGSPDDVARHAARARLAGVAAVTPACGLAMGTPIASVRALASSVLAPPERIPAAADAAVRGTTEVAP